MPLLTRKDKKFPTAPTGTNIGKYILSKTSIAKCTQENKLKIDIAWHFSKILVTIKSRIFSHLSFPYFEFKIRLIRLDLSFEN